MIAYFFGKSIEGNLIDLNLIMIETAKTKMLTAIIGIKNIPGSNEFMPNSNCSNFVIWELEVNDEYNAGNNAGTIDNTVIDTEHKNTRCEIIGLLEKINML